jgi:hypothetical protein
VRRLEGPDAQDGHIEVGGFDRKPGEPGEIWVRIGNSRFYWPSVDDAQAAMFSIAGQLDLLRNGVK